MLTNQSIMANSSDEMEIGTEDDGSDGGYIAYNERLETYLVPVVFGLIFLVGVVGNACLIFILCRHKAMRSVPNTFIFNLALGDLLVLLCAVPFTSTVFTLESWPYGLFVCKASEFAKDTSVGVSVFTLTALSLDRYTAIVRPVQSFVGGPKSKLMILSLAIIWLVSLALALPAAIFSHLIKQDIAERVNGTMVYKQIAICYPFPEELGPNYPKMVVMVRALVHYGIPLLIIGTFYAIMARHLLRSAQNIPGQAVMTTTTTTTTTSVHRNQQDLSNKMETSLLQQSGQAQQQQQQPSQNRARRKVAKMVLSFVVLFAFCFLPMHVYFLWFYFDPKSQDNYNSFWNALKIIGFCLAYINSCINPIALYCVSTSFRKHFNRLLCCCCPAAFRRDHRPSDEPYTTYSHYSRRSVMNNRPSFKTTLTSVGPQSSSSVRRSHRHRRTSAETTAEEAVPLNEFSRHN